MNFNRSSTLNQFAPNFRPMTMGTRLQEALDRRNTAPPAVIAATSLSKGAVYNILNDDTKPDKVRADTVTKICSHLHISRDWLVWGRGDMDDLNNVEDASWEDILGVQQAASLGEGAEPDEYAETHKLKFRADSLKRKRLNPDKLAVIYGKGDSMWPTIKDGDALLVDLADKEPRDEKLFVITYGRDLFAKRLVKLGDRWFIDSDNKADPKWKRPIPVEEAKGFEIHGRVRWIGSWED